MAEKMSMIRREYNLTRGTGALKRGVAERDRDVVNSQLDKLKVLFRLFEQTHDLYDQTLANEDDIDNSTEYFCAAERTYIEAVSDAHTFLSSIRHCSLIGGSSMNSIYGDVIKFNVETVGDNVETVGDNAETVGDNVETVGDNAETVGDNAETVGDNAETVGDNEETVGDNAETVGDNAETVGDNEETVGDNAETVGDNVETVGDNAETVGDNVETVGDNVETVGDNAETVGDNVETVGDNVERVGDQDRCEQGHTSVDNVAVVDKVPCVTRSDVRDGCERGDTCVDDPSVGDNEPYATHIYFEWAMSGPVAGSSRQGRVYCGPTGQNGPCVRSGVADGEKAGVAVECSCGMSVDDACLQGPYLSDTRVHGVLRFWQSNGVECMYMQYEIPEKDSNSRRFFWYFVYYEAHALR